MNKDNVISLENPEENQDLLTGMLRSGARELITKAIQTELTEFLSQVPEYDRFWREAIGGPQRLFASAGDFDWHRPPC